MSQPAIIGREPCGCITYANARPDDLDRESEKDLARIIRSGGDVVRTTVEEARAMPHFLASECPHEPKGWEREPYVDPATKIIQERIPYRNLYIVYRGTRVVGQRRLGEVGKRSGGWWATEGWLDSHKAEARDGREPRGSAKVWGPHPTRKEAVSALTGKAA